MKWSQIIRMDNISSSSKAQSSRRVEPSRNCSTSLCSAMTGVPLQSMNNEWAIDTETALFVRRPCCSVWWAALGSPVIAQKVAFNFILMNNLKANECMLWMCVVLCVFYAPDFQAKVCTFFQTVNQKLRHKCNTRSWVWEHRETKPQLFAIHF